MRTLACLFLSLFALTCAAQQYRWVDEKGRVQYSDVPPPPSAKGVEKKNLRGSVVETGALSYEMSQLTKNFPVTLYTAPACPEGCKQARDQLNARGIPFKEVLVWDVQTSDELKKVSGTDTVPTLVVGRSVQNGYNAGLFDRLLDAAGYPRSLPPRKQAAPPLPENYVAPGAPPPAESKPAAKPQ